MSSHQDLITAAYQELGLIDPVETLSPEMLQFGKDKLNRLLDQWNAIREAVYTETFASHTLTPSLNPHTFGPTGATFTVTQRPVDVFAVNRVVSDISTPLTSRTAEWYASLSSPALSGIPTDFWWSPSWANGSLYLWPVPDAAYVLQVWRRVLLSQITTVTETFSLPPGYWEAIVRTLAENLAPAYNVSVSRDLKDKAAEARAIIFANNIVIPTLQTVDSGMPSSGLGGGFNFLTGRGGGR